MKRKPSRFWVSLAVLLAILLIGPLLVPVLPAPGTLPVEQLADDDSQFIELNGLNVHVKTAGQVGDAETFVLLHGFGASLFSWHAVMEPFSRLGTVIAYDRPAFGLTERPMEWQGENPYGMQANVDLLLALLDHFNVAQAVLVGNSAGGTVAMNFTLQHPERVRALVLVDPAVYTGGGGPSWVRLLGQTPQMQHLGPYLVRSIQKSGLKILTQAWYDPARITAETMELYTRPLKAENWDRALWYFTLASTPGDLPARLQEFTLPVLVLTGEDDRIVPTADSIRLAGELPGASLAVIASAGHVPHEEQPAAFMQAVEAFLADLP